MVVSVRSWVANEGGKHLVLMLWLGVNTWLFLKTFLLYSTGQQYHYLYKMLGLGLCISRASASVLNLNCSLVLLPMCRSLLTFFRGTHKVSSRETRRLLDKSKTFHVACGVAICIFSVVHVSAHLVNVVNFSVSYSDDFPALNLARYKGEDPKLIILTTIPGVTGVLLVLILFLMFTSSSYCVRLSNYEIFWYTHNLFIVFYVILMVHMVGGALKYQTNIEAHPPGCLRANQSSTEQQDEELEQGEDEDRRCKEEAHFQPHYPQTWLWVSGPLCLYCAERFYRYIRSSSPVTIVTVIRHPCNVIELRMLKKNFKARPGQYIVLNCPGVSSFENHPFTLTTCPTENKETFGIHLRVVGDWTERFTQLLLPEPRKDLEILPMVQQRRYPKLYVDGPFGSPSEEVFNYDVSVCVAGGIGVTPFACVLHALLDGWTGFRLQRLYFVWVCRELKSFYWFAELLCALHHKLWQENRPDYFNLRLYVSQTDNLQEWTAVTAEQCQKLVESMPRRMAAVIKNNGYAIRACLRRSIAHSPPGCWSVAPGGSYCLMRSGGPISISESAFSAVDQRASPGLSTDCVTQPDILEQLLNSTRSPSADRTSELVPKFEVNLTATLPFDMYETCQKNLSIHRLAIIISCASPPMVTKGPAG